MFKPPINVMVVDDEEAFVEMLSLSLREMELKVTPAYSGKECLEALEQNNIDVIILDIKMPGMDGIETLGEIRKRYPLVEVIMLTGHGSIATAVEGMKKGAFDYLLKPAEFEDLFSKVEGAKRRKDEHEARIREAEAQALLKESRRGGKGPLSV